MPELRELAQSAATVRQEREARASAKREAARGGASGYDQAVRVLSDLAEGYALLSSREAFDRKLQRLVVSLTRRKALMRRLTDAALWTS